MRRARILLAAFALAAGADLVSLAVGFGPGHTAAKPLLMLLLASWAAVRGAPRLLVAALLFGWGGDVLLLSDAQPAFLAGMASFAAGHVCYLALFRTHGRNAVPRARAGLLAAGYAIALVGILVLLWPGLPAGLRVPVAAYSVLLTAMAYFALTRLGAVAGAGGALFMFSDTLIATGLADLAQPPLPDLWIMATYPAAQFLLARGAPATERPAPTTRPAARPATVGAARGGGLRPLGGGLRSRRPAAAPADPGRRPDPSP
ncbi:MULTISPECIES: lysoplasmalogenase [Streptomyces]|uniref:Lysoplasmalogenase n=1 Tax=Streptomyces cadmiisoli TaxID=2184053 RepID=A0A2Z4J525_9ACTN|nr:MULTISPECIES: lysoplasmalogenase [Streptomyces]AWW40281.1 lysoplasmalogenase [Streptomyces cadmiisoli]